MKLCVKMEKSSSDFAFRFKKSNANISINISIHSTVDHQKPKKKSIIWKQTTFRDMELEI